MQYLAVLAAGAASYAFGAAWYMILAKPWMEAAGIEADENGRPKGGGGALSYLLAFIAALLVAGMTRHVFVLSAIETPIKGLVSGLGLGLFIASPWIRINNAFGGRPFRLKLIDAGHATFRCPLIGLVLTLF